MTDYKSLCAELTDDLEEWIHDDYEADIDNAHALIARARAALAAEPVPPANCPGCEGVPAPGNQPCAVCGREASPHSPDAGEVAELVNHLLKVAAEDESDGCTYDSAFTRRAAELLERLAPQPVPEGPSDHELTMTYAYAVAAAVDNKRGPFKKEDAEVAQLAGLLAVLDRWGQP
jgi:hypothetical protein